LERLEVATHGRCFYAKTQYSSCDYHKRFDRFDAVGKFLKAKIDEGHRPGMTVLYTRTVPEMAEHVGKDRPIMTVDAEDLRAFCGSLRESHSVGGVHHCCRNVEAFFRWFWLEYEIDKFNPIDKVKV